VDKYEFIKVEEVNSEIVNIILNRPEKRNAFTFEMIENLRSIFKDLSTGSYRIAVLKGAGKAFCSGIDMPWMVDAQKMDEKTCFHRFAEITRLFYQIYELKIPVISVVNGPVIGGGVGFIAASDFVIATENANIFMSGARYGLIGTCTVPFIIKRIGEHLTKRFFLTGEKITPERALEINLVDEFVKRNELSNVLDKRTESLLANSPYALEHSKKLFAIMPELNKKQVIDSTAEFLVSLVKSKEVQKGIDAFLNKELPPWAKRG